MNNIIELSSELGDLIKSSQLYQNYNSERMVIDGDKDATVLIQKFDEYNNMMLAKKNNGIEPESIEIEEYNSILANIRQNEKIMKYLEAQSQFVNLITEVNNIIGNSLKI